ncbi:hypothetical protein V6N13_059159 [Hibiscus sabdariffa]
MSKESDWRREGVWGSHGFYFQVADRFEKCALFVGYLLFPVSGALHCCHVKEIEIPREFQSHVFLDLFGADSDPIATNFLGYSRKKI